MSSNSNTSSTVPDAIIRLPILLFKSFISSKMSNEIACELTEREMPIIKEVMLLRLNKSLLTKNPIIKGIKVLKIAIREDSLKFFLNCLRFISNPTKKNNKIIPMFVINENIDDMSFVKSAFFIIGIPRITPAKIWPTTLGSLRCLKISETKYARKRAMNVTNKIFAILLFLFDYKYIYFSFVRHFLFSWDYFYFKTSKNKNRAIASIQSN